MPVCEHANLLVYLKNTISPPFFINNTASARERLWVIGMILQKSCEFLSAAEEIVALSTALIYTQSPKPEKF
jgi:hypothetical protein